MTWHTFDNRKVDLSEDYQHASNLYWFLKIFWKAEEFSSPFHSKFQELFFMIKKKWGIIGDYKPVINFKEEIQGLKNLGLTLLDPQNLKRNIIIFEGKVIGEFIEI